MQAHSSPCGQHLLNTKKYVVSATLAAPGGSAIAKWPSSPGYMSLAESVGRGESRTNSDSHCSLTCSPFSEPQQCGSPQELGLMLIDQVRVRLA
jgi:hypothetical protein